MTAEYSSSLDRIILIAANPNQLHIYDPQTNTDTTVNLPKPPLSLSVSLDGLHAAVGHDALISYVNLQTASLEKTLTATVTVNSLVLGSGYIYVLSNGTSIQISNGASIGFIAAFAGNNGRMHPSGTAIYTTMSGSPGILSDLDVSTGPVTRGNTGPYWGDYPACGGVWFSPDGRRVYTGCATAYQADPQDVKAGLLSAGPLDTWGDGLYWGTLAGTPAINSLAESAALGRVAAIPLTIQYSQPTVMDNQVFLYDSAYLEPAGVFQLPDFIANGKNYQAHGKQVFYNAASTAMYVVMQADGASGLMNDFAVELFSLANPPVCAPAFSSAGATLPAAGTVGTVGITAPASCIYQASSNSNWIQFVSGAYGSGNGALTYIVRPNSGAERTGAISIAGQSFSITQPAALTPNSLLTQLSVSVAGAGYSKALDKAVWIVSSPKELHIYDPISGSDHVVPLPKTPLCLSVGPDGQSAAVGFDGWASLVNLSAATVTTTVQAFTDVHTVLLAGNGYMYGYPRDTWGNLFSIQVATGAINVASAIYSGRDPQLYYDGSVFYTEGSKWNILSGPAQMLWEDMSGGCAPFWLTEDGARMITSCGTAYTTSPVPSLDQQYNGSFSNATSIQWANESSVLHSTAVIPSVGYSGTGSVDTYVQAYGDAYIGYAGELPLPVFMIGSTPYAGHGRYAFWNSRADKLIVLEQADSAAKLAADYGVVVYSMTTPAAGCTFALGSTSAAFDQNGGLNTVNVTTGVGCIWEVSSAASWITVNSGAVGFGSGTMSYAVAANAAYTPRTATLSIGGQQFTVTQQAAPCTVNASPASVYLDETAQISSVAVTAVAPTCPWAVTPAGGFISIIGGASGTGSGAFSFSVTANGTSADRTGSIALGSQTVTVTQRATANVFTDVPPAAYYYNFVNMIDLYGITSGCLSSPPEFCPDETVTRDEMAVFLVTAVLGINNFNYTPTPYFTDVPPTAFAFKFIQKLRDLGITNGCSANEFCPSSPVTRDEMAAFIIRARYETTPYTYPTTPYFSDVPSNDMFFPSVQKMAQMGITAGCGPNLYCAGQSLPRGQMAVFIVTGLLNQLVPAGVAYLQGAAPNSASAGQSVTVTLTGAHTHFAQGTTQVTVAPGMTASNVTVTSATSLTVQLTLGAGMTTNPTSIIVTTGTEEADLPNGFQVK